MLLMGERRSVTACGDDDQSIYSFLSAVPHIFAQFQQHFGARQLCLQTNFRWGGGGSAGQGSCGGWAAGECGAVVGGLHVLQSIKMPVTFVSPPPLKHPHCMTFTPRCCSAASIVGA